MADRDKPSRTRAVLIVDAELLDRARDAAAALAGRPLYLNLGLLVDRALATELGKLERRFNNGKRFPRRPGPLRGGRRPKPTA